MANLKEINEMFDLILEKLTYEDILELNNMLEEELEEHKRRIS